MTKKIPIILSLIILIIIVSIVTFSVLSSMQLSMWRYISAGVGFVITFFTSLYFMFRLRVR